MVHGGINFIGGWVGLIASLDTVEKKLICCCQEFDLDFPVVQPIT
jgi:hypothetical protein